MPKLEITSQERSALRAAAHSLKPVVMIGDKGLTDAVLKEIDSNLTAHALIKVRVTGQERDVREDMLARICDQLSCAPVHHLGKILILHRPQATEPAPVMETRAVRKPSEPYTPKKQAATGAKRTRKDEKQQRAAQRKAADTDAKPAPLARSRTTIPSSIPRRSGSALSLRAGARRTTPRSR